MFNFFLNLSPVFQTLIASLITYSFTIMGSSVVFLFKKLNTILIDIILGISAGIMLSATIFSLLNPAFDYAESLGQNSLLIVPLGIASGALFLYVIGLISERVLKKNNNSIKSKKVILMFLSITLHNIPEGMVIGIAFGLLSYSSASVISALSLALGIAIQNFPEGSCLSLPMHTAGFSKKKSFFLGQLSGIVEPIFACLGCILVTKTQSILPFSLAFASGSCLYVIISEIIPSYDEKQDLVALFTILGFILMMMLDVGLS